MQRKGLSFTSKDEQMNIQIIHVKLRFPALTYLTSLNDQVLMLITVTDLLELKGSSHFITDLKVGIHFRYSSQDRNQVLSTSFVVHLKVIFLTSLRSTRQMYLCECVCLCMCRVGAGDGKGIWRYRRPMFLLACIFKRTKNGYSDST